MTNTSSQADTSVDSAPAEPLLAPVESQENVDERKKSKSKNKKVVLAREPSTLDPTRYGDWEKNGRCIDF